ncbi:MAG: histidine phosphatase family protein [Desulfovibrio sp.]|nr:histidine phosphatase family protein [Desulfovibrio sp.]
MLVRRVCAARDFWQKRYPQKNLLIVSHAGVLRSLVALYLATPLNQLLRIPLSYASTFFLPLADGKWLSRPDP